MQSIPKTDAESCYNKNRKYESTLYSSTELSIDWISSEFENQALSFSRKIKSLKKHNSEVTVSVS